MATPAQIRAGRHLAKLSQNEIASLTGLSIPTIKRVESDREVAVSADAVATVRHALEAAGVIFIDENGGGAGVRLRKQSNGSNHPKPVGPATDVMERMDAAIEEHKALKRQHRKRGPTTG